MLSFLLLAPQAAAPSLIPLPQKVEWGTGAFTLNASTRLTNEGAGPTVVARLREALAQPLKPGKKGDRAVSLVKMPGLPAEGYLLDVDAKTVSIRASSDAGFFYGIQTLRQLNLEGGVPACRIVDQPRFGWRGLMLDESRHFFGGKFVRKFIDGMAAHKLNTFHWHLTDDGGWRMESKRYPALTEVGAWRKPQPVEWDYGNLWFPGPGSGEKLYGGSYSSREIRDMVRYAAERYITIVPEIEMPGHSAAAAAAHPELQCSGPNKAEYLKATRSQAPMMICPGKDSTIEFCKGVLDDAMALFPSKFIHIGADEVDKSLWKQCPDCQARMKANGLKDEHELQSWFVRQMDSYLASKGRRLVGWDEILEGGLAPGATVMSWRGIQGGIAAAKAGHDVVMSPTSHCYLDYGYDTTPTEKVYGFDPIPTELVGAERTRVLGGQGNVWTEYLSSPEEVEGMVYPRALALAEALWTQPERKSWSDFRVRMEAHVPRLDRMGIAFRLEPPVLEPSVLNVVAGTGEWKVVGYGTDSRELLLNGARVPRGLSIRATKGEYSFAFELPSGRKSEVTMGRAVQLKTVVASMDGITRKKMPWKKTTAPTIADFDGVPEDGKMPSLSLEATPTDDPFAALFEGELAVTEKGRYTLILGSDDGSVLYLDGQRVLANDGLHGYLEKTATIDLEPGVYRFHVSFFDAGEAKRVTLGWVTPSGKRESLGAGR